MKLTDTELKKCMIDEKYLEQKINELRRRKKNALVDQSIYHTHLNDTRRRLQREGA